MSMKLEIGKKGIRKALDSEKMTKCTPNDKNGVHLYTRVWNLYAKVWHIYYINVRQIVGSKRSTPLWHKCGEKLRIRISWG